MTTSTVHNHINNAQPHQCTTMAKDDNTMKTTSNPSHLVSPLIPPSSITPLSSLPPSLLHHSSLLLPLHHSPLLSPLFIIPHSSHPPLSLSITPPPCNIRCSKRCLCISIQYTLIVLFKYKHHEEFLGLNYQHKSELFDKCRLSHMTFS